MLQVGETCVCSFVSPTCRVSPQKHSPCGGVCVCVCQPTMRARVCVCVVLWGVNARTHITSKPWRRSTAPRRTFSATLSLCSHSVAYAKFAIDSIINHKGTVKRQKRREPPPPPPPTPATCVRLPTHPHTHNTQMRKNATTKPIAPQSPSTPPRKK